MTKKIFVVIGAGPGIGNHVAEKFGKEGYHVVLMSRNQSKLDQYVTEFKEKNISVSYSVVDFSDKDTIEIALTEVKNTYNKIDVLFYNVAYLQPNKIETLSTGELEESFKIDVANALFSVQQVIPEQIKQKNGTILFTGGGLALKPSGEFTSISLNKASLRNLAFILADDLKEKGIFVGIVTITGDVKPHTHFSPKLIAEKFWQLAVNQNETEIIY